MRIEGFTEGKNLDDPAANEDQLLVLPGRGYAVIDGVTDRTAHLYDGMLAGRMAAGVVQAATAAFLLDPAESACDPGRLVARLTDALQAAYARFGVAEEARARPARRFGATLALAAHVEDRLRVVLVGDSGVRFDGRELHTVDPGLDLVTSLIRQLAWRLVEEAGGERGERVRVSRACVFNGLARLDPDMRPFLDEARLGALRESFLAEAGTRFPHVPVEHLERLADGGIIDGQGRFQNNTRSPLSYAVLDGFEVPMELVRVIDRPLPATLELFTDGYFVPGAEPTVESWERSFERVEHEDPDKLSAHPSVKGTVGRIRADDRTVVIVSFAGC